MYSVKIDFQDKKEIPKLHFCKNDKYSRFVKLVLYNNGVPYYDIASKKFLLRYKASSGQAYYSLIDGHSAFSANTNELTCEISEAMLSESGEGTFDVRIYDASSNISTWNIPFDVE